MLICRVFLLLGLLLISGGRGGAGPALGAEAERLFIAPGIELPDSEGKGLILRACTSCHDLKGISLFKGYWDERQWLALVKNMKDHGATLSDAEAAQAARYLSRHFGRE